MRLIQLSILLLLTVRSFSQIADSSLRHVPLQGAINFRDLGGYSTTDGRHVKWHLLYRSADISKLTAADLDTLKARHIFFDVDLRGTAESAKAPDRINSGTDYILCPAGSDSINTAMFRNLAAVTNGDSLMTTWYTNTNYLTPRYRPFFDKLIAVPGNDALLFHCTAGKDRTGIAAALLLYALGVPYATIREDYTATNYYRAADNEKFTKTMAESMHIRPEVAQSMSAAKGNYLDATFDALRSRYGSIDQYLETQLGLTPEKREQLKNKFLTP